MSQYRCESCDIPLTPEQLRVEVGVCPKCRAELDAAPLSPWPTSAREVELTRERGEK